MSDIRDDFIVKHLKNYPLTFHFKSSCRAHKILSVTKGFIDICVLFSFFYFCASDEWSLKYWKPKSPYDLMSFEAKLEH